MGKTSSAVKDRWNAQHYDTIRFNVPKGNKAIIQERANKAGVSLSEYIRLALDQYNKPLQ